MLWRWLKILGIVLGVVLYFSHSKAQEPPEHILIGNAISLTGPYSVGAKITQIPNFDMWIEEVNAKGGIFVKEYNKRIPLKLIRYDDKSDIGTMVRLIEKLCVEDKVNFLLPPWGTAMHFAIAPIANKYEYPIIGPTVSSEKLRELVPKYSYFFAILNQPRQQAPALVDLLAELEIKKVAVVFVEDLHGIEWTSILAPELGKKEFEIVLLKSYPLGSKDVSPLIKQAMSLNAEAFLAISYPEDTMLFTKQAIDLNFNPKVFYCGVGTAFPTYRDNFGSKTIEGVMGHGAWNPRVPYAGAKEYFEKHKKRWGTEPDRWASAFAYASVQVLQQAIEKAGTLNRKKVKEIIAYETFETIIGPVRFQDGFNIQSPGEIGQWQHGEFEIVAAKEKRTSKPIFPKPAWPSK
uniref:Branched-chain amino acid ABC transporter substrate-binding protein n=1 Tax=candidate division WOR-3 bacterium TaxID=2052148 RepID=A0A7C2P025_UNCW3